MCSLGLFAPVCDPGYNSVCESNGHIVSLPESTFKPHNTVRHYPAPSVAPELKASEFLNPDPDSLLISPSLSRGIYRYISVWRQRGAQGVIDDLASENPERGSSWWFHVLQWLVSFTEISRSLKIRGLLFWLYPAEDDAVMDYSPSSEWPNAMFRALAWHPHSAKFAVALRDDSIRVCNVNLSSSPVLKHRLQRNVNGLAWRPFTSSVLAVACSTCVLVWHLDPASTSTKPPCSCVQILKLSRHSPVTSVSWEPNGDLLLSSSPCDTAIILWDLEGDASVPLKRIQGNGNPFSIYSPDATKIVSATRSNVFRIWELREVCAAESWTVPSGRLSTACWSNDGRYLLFSTTKETNIYALNCESDSGSYLRAMATSKRGRNDRDNEDEVRSFETEKKTRALKSAAAAPVIDLTPIENVTDETTEKIGGVPNLMVWDPRNERLAISFSPKSPDLPQEIVAVFRTRISPTLEISPCGFIRGPKGEFPLVMDFQKNVSESAVLTVGWSNGAISHIPFIYPYVGEPDLPDLGTEGTNTPTPFILSPRASAQQSDFSFHYLNSPSRRNTFFSTNS